MKRYDGHNSMLLLAICGMTSCGQSKQDDTVMSSIDTGTEDSAVQEEIVIEEPDTTDTGVAEPDPWEGIAMQDVVFQSTHNSYSGEERGTILEQLDAGVRGLEFDIHDNDFATAGDYQLGHSIHGSEVELGGGNPESVLLRDWLMQIQEWSKDHPSHAPITITLDMKDNLTDNESHEEGGFSALQELLLDVFSTSLVPVTDTLPTLEELRGRVLVVLSGDEQSRKHYKRDKGEHPAVSINDSGQVMEVHASGTGSLWYWTGQKQEDGTIRWMRHGRYDSGDVPAIALNNEGYFVEVHKSQLQNTLWYHAGFIDEEYQPHFSSSTQFDTGTNPTVRFVDKSTNMLREIHRSETTGLSWDWDMELDAVSFSLTLGEHTQCMDDPFEKSQDEGLIVSTDVDGAAASDTLLYAFSSSPLRRIRYPQIAFVEFQQFNGQEIYDHECMFSATSHSSMSPLSQWQQEGKVTRVWGVEASDLEFGTMINFPAVDHPFAPWYTQYCLSVGCVE